MENKKLGKFRQQIEKDKVDAINVIIVQTLEKIQELEIDRENIHENIRVLKHDLTDFKEGRLDRIVGRHEISVIAEKASVFSIEKKKGQKESDSHWYDDYNIKVFPIKENAEIEGLECTINNSIAKLNSSGSYKLDDGSIRHI